MSTTKTSIDWYNDNAQKYTEHLQNRNDSIYHHYYEKPAMYSLLPKLHNKKILSTGCGPGEDCNYLSKQGAEAVYGIDISSELIAVAQSNYPECQFSVMDMETLDFQDETFDFVYSSLAVHYLDDWTKMMSETFRVLKTGGVFLFSCGHPLDYAMVKLKSDNENFSKKGIVSTKNKETGEVIIEGNYFSKEPRPLVFDGVALTNYSKTFEEIISYARNAGFAIEEIIEPKPIPELQTVNPEVFKKLNVLPAFVIIKLAK